MKPIATRTFKQKLKLLVVTFTLLLPFYLLLSSSSLRALGCGDRCWYPETGQLDCDDPLPCASNPDPFARVCWRDDICGGGSGCEDPGQPTNLSFDCADSNDEVTFSWSAGSGADYHSLRLFDITENDNDPPGCDEDNSLECADTTETSHTFPVVSTHEYDFWLHSRVDCDDGRQSAAIHLIPVQCEEEEPPPPEPTGCRAPHNLRVSGSCREDGEASVRWTWEPIYIAQTYRLQVSLDSNFSALEVNQVVGPTTSFYVHSLENPNQIRYSRVKFESVNPYFEYEELEGACPGGFWLWTDPPVSSIFSCEEPTPPDETEAPRIISKYFCDSRGNPTEDPDTGKLFSAIGCIPIDDVQEFTEFILTWGTRVAGGVSLLLIVYGGFLFMTSQGNPKKVQAGKELITAAVGGLIYLLFAVFMFRFIGLDILKIPGL